MMHQTSSQQVQIPPATCKDTLARLKGVRLVYADTAALDGVDLTVSAGERLCVLGQNGSGKSTLASVLCGLLAPDAGEVQLAGQTVYHAGQADFSAYRRARHHIGLVFQNPDDQIVTSVVEEDVAFGPENLGLPPAEIEARVRREIHRVALDDYAKADPTRLSGGQKQRVAIAGALAMEPRMIVFDEPAALLDVRGRRSILEVMDQLRAAGIAVVHVTHYMEEALGADRVIVMGKGRIQLEGTPQEVFSHTEEIAQLGLEEPFAARLSRKLARAGLSVAWTADEAALEQEIRHICPVFTPQARSTRRSDAAAPAAAPAPATPATPAIRVEHVSFDFEDGHAGHALKDVSFEVAPGQNVALIGQTGSGKSTLLRLICALDVPDTGRITIDGIDTKDKRQARMLHGKIGYVMQMPERQLFAETVWQDVAFGPKNMGYDADKVSHLVKNALELVGLANKTEASPFELSGGQQRLCALAGVLAMEPHTLILDEPTAGLDPQGRHDFEQILDKIHARHTTIVRVTHSMEEAARADRIFVLNQSELLLSGTPAVVFSPEHAHLLHDCGLGVPKPLSWALKLQAGDKYPELPLTLDELAESIVASAQSSGGEPYGA
ncbi:MAG: ABC transporter ATP-binding protein [Atopobiaceae bacterium]|jgi:energy-coupling factor transporter ATPase